LLIFCPSTFAGMVLVKFLDVLWETMDALQLLLQKWFMELLSDLERSPISTMTPRHKIRKPRFKWKRK
jgi:hypothetical protein